MLYLIVAFTALFAYLLGSINTSIILSKSIYGSDIRSSGSGNAGATNMLRTHGKGIAIATLICDVLKGTIAVVIASCVELAIDPGASGSTLSSAELFLCQNLKYIAGVFAVLGHDFPIFFGFRGGKGVATSLGVVLALNWQVGLILCAVALIIMICSRYVSLGSITAAGLYPFILFTYLLAGDAKIEESLGYILMSFILAFLLIGKHHSNIKKLLSGSENKLFAKKATANIAEDINQEE